MCNLEIQLILKVMSHTKVLIFISACFICLVKCLYCVASVNWITPKSLIRSLSFISVGAVAVVQWLCLETRSEHFWLAAVSQQWQDILKIKNVEMFISTGRKKTKNSENSCHCCSLQWQYKHKCQHWGGPGCLSKMWHGWSGVCWATRLCYYPAGILETTPLAILTMGGSHVHICFVWMHNAQYIHCCFCACASRCSKLPNLFLCDISRLIPCFFSIWLFLSY